MVLSKKMPSMSFIKKFFSGDKRSATVKKNVVGLVLLKGTSMLASFMLVPMTIGYVSPELYGIWLTLSSIITWIGFLDIGFSQGLKNKLTEAIAKDEWEKGRYLVSTTYFMMMLIFVPICIIIEAIIPFVNWTELLNIDPQYEQQVIQAMSALMAFACLQMIVNVVVSVIAAFQQVALSNSFLVIGNILSLIAIFILTKTVSPSLLVLTCSLATMPILVTIIASIILYSGKFKRVSPNPKFIEKKYIGDIMGLGYKFFLINIQVVVVYQSTNVLISHVSSPLEVAQYNIAYKLLSCAMMLYTIITTPLWPAYTDAFTRGDYVWMRTTRNKMGKILILSVLSCFFLACISTPIYKIWLNDALHVPFYMTLSVASYVSAFCWMNFNSTMVVGMSKMALHTILAMAGMVVHIPLSLFLGQSFGAIGVLISLVTINGIYAAIMHLQVIKLLNKQASGIWAK